MKTLCLFFLAGENVRSLYTQALAGLDVDLVLALPGAGSAVNARWVLDAPGPGSRLERVARRMGALPLDRYDRVVCAGFSAGYGAIRELLDDPASAARIDGVVSLDAWHDSLSFGRLGSLEAYARRALAGDVVLHLAHTDTPTPQTGPDAYASTTQVARELCRRIGHPAPPTPEVGPEPHTTERLGLRVAAYNTDAPAWSQREHSQALIGWGPAFLAAAIRAVTGLQEPPGRAEPAPPAAPTPTSLGDRGPAVEAWQRHLVAEGYDPGTPDGVHGPRTEAATAAWRVDQRPTPPDAGWSLGERCLYWIGGELARDPRELPGDRHDPRILSYSRHCRRGGRLLGVDASGAPLWAGGAPLPLPRDEDAWCAAAQSAALLGALRPGETPPHGLRVAVRELVEDARAAGTLRGADYTPQPGDLAIYARGTGDPMRGGTGHVRAVVGVDPDASTYLGVGGNEGNRWTWARHPMRPPTWRAWIARG